MDWDDLKYVLALHRAGTLVRAGKLLHVNTSTVGRRILALEQSLEAKLFDRIGGGYQSTPAALRVVACAEEMELQANAMHRQIKGLDNRVEGSVRITALDNFLDAIVVPALPEFLRRNPEIEITLESDLRLFELTEGDADIAVRSVKPVKPELVARSLGSFPAGFYQRRGMNWAGNLPLIGLPARPEHAAYNDSLVAKVPRGRIVARANTEARITELVKLGVGIGFIDCFVGELDPSLERIPGFGLAMAEVWAIAHVDMRRSPRVLATLDFLKDAAARASWKNVP
ncbi:LysR family transcriptional regulator [Ostreiculturibacter nitratireducens]|uniref:LysR family transcriptional regulator n=1 Tax=Ostreiculturibacter nitratireducens TaxID=3075226 RepID=UPI0031B5B754